MLFAESSCDDVSEEDAAEAVLVKECPANPFFSSNRWFNMRFVWMLQWIRCSMRVDSVVGLRFVSPSRPPLAARVCSQTMDSRQEITSAARFMMPPARGSKCEKVPHSRFDEEPGPQGDSVEGEVLLPQKQDDNDQSDESDAPPPAKMFKRWEDDSNL